MIRIKSPGRICLFGEHQDYLDYPIISMAISKYIYLEAQKISAKKFEINLPDLNQSMEIPLNNKELEYKSKRDYLKSGYNQFIRQNIRFNKGFKIRITGDIPINAGVASSSALVICWLYFLNFIAERKIEPFQMALEGYNTEVKEFQEGGGMMDHFTSVFGNLIFLKPEESKPQLKTYDLALNGFVLGNSMEKKTTVDDLIRTKFSSLKAFEVLKSVFPKFGRFYTKLDEIESYLPSIKEEYKKKIIGNIINRDITNKAKDLIENYIISVKQGNSTSVDREFYQKLGTLLNQHQDQLRDNIGVSTSKINKIIEDCLETGAFGGKINGSGFGGTMFALFPNNEQTLKKTIENAGGKAYNIKTSYGVEMY
ncbi:MAG: mevalonate kinase family protein [Promethearchaeota archaeon]